MLFRQVATSHDDAAARREVLPAHPRSIHSHQQIPVRNTWEGQIRRKRCCQRANKATRGDGCIESEGCGTVCSTATVAGKNAPLLKRCSRHWRGQNAPLSLIPHLVICR